MNGIQNEEEIFKGCMRKLELGKLANEGNIYAKHQQTFERCGLGVNLEALLPRDACKHLINYGNGYFERRTLIQTTKREGFIFREIICTLCGKTLETRIRKPKRPRRRF